MFGQLKDIYNLRKQAAELQKQMQAEKITVNSPDNLITLTINGNHELLDVKINSELSATNANSLENSFREAFNKAENELKTVMTKKFQGMI